MMEGDASMKRIDRKSSIESEPRTLRMDQIQFAREAALCVMHTRSIEEALSVFLEGLEPVVNVARRKGDTMRDVSSDMQSLEDQLRLPDLRDIASAPF